MCQICGPNYFRQKGVLKRYLSINKKEYELTLFTQCQSVNMFASKSVILGFSLLPGTCQSYPHSLEAAVF